MYVPEAKRQDLRRSIAATQWPERETVADDTQGVQLAPGINEARQCVNRVGLPDGHTRDSYTIFSGFIRQ